jgi:hypothetical protein
MERSLRLHVETTGNALPGWDQKETTRPTAFMLMTKFAAVIVLKIGPQRQLAQALSAVQQQYLSALGVPTAYFTGASGGEDTARGVLVSRLAPEMSPRGGHDVLRPQEPWGSCYRELL